jgi:HAD superfamily phosphatase (TIGR01668 family)
MILKPDYNLNSVYDIDFKEIKALGINAVLFDLDSTVMPSKSGEYPEKVVKMFEEIKQNFVVAIISNNKNKEYISKVQAMSNFTVIGEANKPSPRVMKEFLKSVNIEPSQTVVVGDRPLTDILAGKLLGAKTILVDSITRETENKPTRIVRALERLTIKK